MAGSRYGVGGARWRVVDALNADWQQVVHSRPPQAAGWCRSAGIDPDGGLPELVRRASLGCDEVLHVLLTEVLQGDALAARTVLQAILGRLVQLASRDATAAVDDYVAAAWCVLSRYPLAARPVRIAANLALDTLKAVRREADGWGRSSPPPWLAGSDLEPLVDREWRRRDLDHGPGARLDAAAVIAAGRRLELLDERAARLLDQVYVAGLSGAEAARAHGSTAGSVRVRCSRAVRVLAAHAAELAEAA